MISCEISDNVGGGLMVGVPIGFGRYEYNFDRSLDNQGFEVLSEQINVSG